MSNARRVTHHGRCLCGSVAFTIQPPLRPIDFCHCRQCRRQFGDHAAATGGYTSNLGIKCAHDGALGWYDSSAQARRGFCRDCGTALFVQRQDMDWTAIAAGALDDPTGLPLGVHIFVAEMAPFDAICDDRPQYPGFARIGKSGD